MEEEKKLTLEELKESSYKLTDKVLSDLTNAFNNDFTVEEACVYAGIVKDTYYNWVKLSDEFAGMMERAKLFVFYAAKRNIAQAVNKGSIEDAWKLLSKRQKDIYSDRQEQTGEGGSPLFQGAQIIINSSNGNNTDTPQQ